MANLPTKNKNPGDLRNTSSGNFKSYSSPGAGYNALKQDLLAKINGTPRLNDKSTLYDFASVYAPKSDNNDPKAYAEKLAVNLGVPPHTPIGTLRGRLDDFASAISKNEGFQGTASSSMTTAQFAAKLKQKYPAYASMPDAQLVAKVVGKYPQYKTAISDLPTLAVSVEKPPEKPNFLKAMGKAFSDVTGATTLGEDIGTLAGYAATKVTNPEAAKFYDTSAPSPGQALGAAMKAVSAPLALAAAPETLAGTIGASAAAGAAQGAGTSLEKGADLGTAIKEGGKAAVIGGAGGAAAFGLGAALNNLGTKILNSIVKPTQADIRDGYSVSTIKEFDLGGNLRTMQQKTEDTIKGLASQLKEKLGSSDSSINLADVYKETQKEIKSTGSKLSTFGSNTRMETALQQLSDEVKAVASEKGLSIPDAQAVKQAAGQLGAWQYGKPDPDAKAIEKVYNAFYRNLKTAIEKNTPEGVREINQKLSKLIPVSHAIIRRIPVAERQSALGLGDFITLSASMYEPRALLLEGANLISKSGAAGRLMTKAPSFAKSIAAPLAGATASLVASGPENTK